jgi:hypothetical protein
VIVPVSAVETVEALIDVVTRTIIKGGLLGFRRPNFTIEARPLHYILLLLNLSKRRGSFRSKMRPQSFHYVTRQK